MLREKDSKKSKYLYRGFQIGLIIWIILMLYFALYFHWNFYKSNWFCDITHIKCSYIQHLWENLPRIFIVFVVDLLSQPFWLGISLGIIFIPTILGYLIDIFKNKKFNE